MKLKRPHVDWERIEAIERDLGFNLPPSTIPERALQRKKRADTRKTWLREKKKPILDLLANIAAGAIVVAIVCAIGFGFYEWWRPGAKAPLPPLPPLPKHAFFYPTGGFVVEDGYEYLKRILCTYYGEGAEPKLESMPGGYKLVLCGGKETEGRNVYEAFRFSRTREWKEP